MSLNGAPQPGAEAEERPAWFTAYLESLNIKREEVQAVALENVLNEFDDISEVFKNKHEALNQQLPCCILLHMSNSPGAP